MAMEQALKTIGGIHFALFSPNEIRKYSVAEITQPETYDEDGMPVQGGLMDNRLGTLEPGQKCGTCGNTAGRCPGHFGHVELAEPVLHIAFVDEINRLLQTTCRGYFSPSPSSTPTGRGSRRRLTSLPPSPRLSRRR